MVMVHLVVPFSPMQSPRFVTTTRTDQTPSNFRLHASSSSVDEQLIEIARKLKLEIFDLDEGIYGFDASDQNYGIEVVKTNIDISKGNGGIGLVLQEIAGDADGRGLVLIREITPGGNAAEAEPMIEVGDVITGVWVSRSGSNHEYLYRERSTGLNYDLTVEILGQAKSVALEKNKGILTLKLNRLIRRAPIRVEVDDGSGSIKVIDALAGENLRRLLLRQGVQLYDRKTKRFDMPYASGDCAGDGLCGTCLVAIQGGEQSLNAKDGTEALITKGRPLSWRASCRCVVGADNQPATLRIATHPQSRFADELDPGVRSL
jgi:ferredoxin